MGRFILIHLLLVIASLSAAKGQTTISGKVSDANTGEPLPGINVLFTPLDGNGIYGYSITDMNGMYSYKHNIKADSLNITVTGSFIKKVSKKVSNNTSSVDFKVVYETLKIDEVVVKATPIKRKGDTLNYYVASYIDTLQDRVIGDVLKKMPGIDITSGGQIYYNNRPINKFYIEGLELMGGRYGVAVKNVRAKDISRVEVFENHQPIKALQEIELSQDAAINLRLKEGSKGSIIASILIGAGGFDSVLWNSEISLMKFADKRQTLVTYKSNNSGDDIGSELSSYYDQISKDKTSISVHLPQMPKTDRERYMDNTTHTASINHILKLGNKSSSSNTLNVNVTYLHDKQNYNSNSTTTYYLPNTLEQLTIDEAITATGLSDEIETKLHYNVNNKNIYLSEQIAFDAEWKNDHGTVINNSQTINQKLKNPNLRLQNNLSLVKVFNNNVHLSYSSLIRASSTEADLHIPSIIYPDYFKDTEARSALQKVDNDRVYTKNQIYVNKSFNNGIKFLVSTGLTADIQKKVSTLAFDDTPDVADSLRNNIIYRQIDIPLSTKISYSYRNYSIYGIIGTSYSYADTDDKITSSDKRHSKYLLNSNIMVDIDLSQNLKFIASGAVNEYLGSVSNMYSGYIMTDYRIISNSDSDIAKYRINDYYVMLNYSNALLSLFGSVKASYRQNRSNIMYDTDYIGMLSHTEAYNMTNTTRSMNIESKFEKRFDNISTTIGIPFSIGTNTFDVLRQKKIMKSYTDRLSTGLEISSNITDNIFVEYKTLYTRLNNRIKDYSRLKTINTVHQDLTMNYTFSKKYIFSIRGEHYMNEAIVTGSKNIFFLDSSFSIKAKKAEFIITGRNILNTNSYNQYIYSDAAVYQYSYKIRPFSMMFKVRFNIG